MSEMGRRIQVLRREAALSRQEMARRLNVQYSHYLEVEKGTVQPGRDLIEALASTLGVPGSEITGRAAPQADGIGEAHTGTIRRLVLRQKALLELLMEKGVFRQSEFEEAYRGASKGS